MKQVTKNDAAEYLAFREKFLACFPKPGEILHFGGRGRGAKDDIATVANYYKARLNKPARKLAENHPNGQWWALEILQEFAYPLDEEQREEIEESDEAMFQAVDLETGHIAQEESHTGFQFSDLDDGRRRMEAVIIPSAILQANFTGTVHFVRMERWCITNDHRNGGKGEPDTLNGRTSLFQHKVYVSDSPHKVGFLRFAIVHPGGRVERAGYPEEVRNVKGKPKAKKGKATQKVA